MSQKLKEIKEEAKRIAHGYWRDFMDIRNSAEVNRQYLPTHPMYIRQYRRDLGRGVVIAATATFMSLGVAGYAGNLDARSEKRAQDACVLIRCKENLEEMDRQQGIDPASDPRVNSALSYRDVKTAIDQTNWYDDRLPIAVGFAAVTVANIFAGLYISRPYINHRRRLIDLQRKKAQN